MTISWPALMSCAAKRNSLLVALADRGVGPAGVVQVAAESVARVEIGLVAKAETVGEERAAAPPQHAPVVDLARYAANRAARCEPSGGEDSLPDSGVVHGDA